MSSDCKPRVLGDLPESPNPAITFPSSHLLVCYLFPSNWYQLSRRILGTRFHGSRQDGQEDRKFGSHNERDAEAHGRKGSGERSTLRWFLGFHECDVATGCRELQWPRSAPGRGEPRSQSRRW